MTYSEVFEIVLQIVVLIIGGLIIPYLKNKIGETKYTQIIEMVSIAVGASEQIFKNLPKGEEKNEKRYQYVVDYLNKNGIKMTEDELKAFIEDAVFRINREVFQ